MEREKLTEGKMKIVWLDKHDPDRFVIVEAKDVVSARDGLCHAYIAEKGIEATATACNVFSVLEKCGEATAYQARVGEREFRANRCIMIPYEFIVRREACGSYLGRHPNVKRGARFLRPQLEILLKTAKREWSGIQLVSDDPLVMFQGYSGRGRGGIASLYRPDRPIEDQKPFLELDDYPLAEDDHTYEIACRSAVRSFLILEKCWEMLGLPLVDMKAEFGFTPDGRVVLADAIDNDCWTVLQGAEHLDKRAYGTGATLTHVGERYREVNRLTRLFRVPRQCITVWLPFEEDDILPFTAALSRHSYNGRGGDVVMNLVRTTSDHGPDAVLAELQDMVGDGLERVIIFRGDRCGQLGRSVERHSPFPVVFVPKADVPELASESVSTGATEMSSEDAAVRDALRILAERNPRLWADLQLRCLGFDNLSLG